MSSMSTKRSFPSSSSYSSSKPSWKYDVFLSFGGEDTIKNFTDHLYAALIRCGIHVFRDGQNLERSGKIIRPEILKAIEESGISIIILSRTYAYSTWCLAELDKIIECKNKLIRQKVVPVFYDVDPSSVRKQTGSFQEAFDRHEEVFHENPEKVRKWRAAMNEVANLSGYHLMDRHESEFIQDIVKDISFMLRMNSIDVSDLVGIDSRLEKLMSLHVRIGLDNVGMIGIYGMGGIGKTTIARVFYERMSCQFEGSSFLANVREVSERGDVIHLQKQLLSQILTVRDINIRDSYDGIAMIRNRLRHKRVLVVIDDVDQLKQLEYIAGEHDWFGSGSRIVITTRDRGLLHAHGVNEVYGVDGLEHDEALHLFSLKAFHLDHPVEGFVELSRHCVKYAGGLPLALRVLGSSLFGKTIDVWKGALMKLKAIPQYETLNVLKLSFDGLEETEKEIFLHVACFFKGKNIDRVMMILDYCNLYPHVGIRVLINKSLIIMLGDKLWLHDTLQDFGRSIVRQESIEEPGKRSRLWRYNDAYHVLTTNTGTSYVDAMVLDMPKLEEARLSAEAFSKLTSLKLLKLRNVNISYGLKHLSNELRFLKWHGYPFRYMPSSFQPDELVELNMCYSHIKQLWNGIKLLNKLKIIKLSHSQNLLKTPDFSGVPNLEKLILEDCSKLMEVDQSIGVLERLTLLNLKDCKSLVGLPSSICGLKSLKTLSLFGCSKLEIIPENLGCVECLEELDISGTAIRQPPYSIFKSRNLKVLSLSGCKGPSTTAWRLVIPLWLWQRKIPDSISLLLPSLSRLSSLTELDLSDCNIGEGEIPDDIDCLSSLRKLNLSSNNFVSLPPSINQLSNLQVLHLNNCKRLQSLPELPSNPRIWAEACSSLKTLSDPFDCDFYAFRCFQLMENQGYNSMAFSTMKRYLKGVSSPSNPRKRDRFDIVLPGGEILEWFNHQSEGFSISIKRPPLLHNSKNSKLMGFALCCIFVVHEHPPVLGDYDLTWGTHVLTCVRRADSKYFRKDPAFSFDDKLGQAVSEHLWLLYLCCDSEFFETKWPDYSNIEFSFRSRDSPSVEVKKCGVRPVYEHDVEEFNQTTDYKCSSSYSEKFNDFHQDFDKSAMHGVIYDGAEPTRSDSFVDEDPYPK